jgi:ABC-type antimicrobial peptide transport system permease subunit
LAATPPSTGLFAASPTVMPADEMTPEMASGLARISTLLRAMATAVFAIACANVATLLLSRASARARDTSVQVALGASRAQLTRQLLADSILVTVVGGLLTAWMMMLVPVLFNFAVSSAANSTAIGHIASFPREVMVIAKDACDPDTFNAALKDPNACKGPEAG